MKTRREFLFTTGKAAMALGLSQSVASAFANNTKATQQATAQFAQKPLPYHLDALQVAIDAQTMDIHYNKHAAAYCKNLNEAYAAEVGTKQKSLEDILKKITKYSEKMRNNAGGHFNHEMFWQCLTPATTDIPEKLSQKITEQFGSIDNFKTQFTDAAKNRFGSGWTWLIQTNDGALQIISTPNQDNPLMNISKQKGKPILCLDVWEHAYYLRYQNKRADYITNFWKIVNWNFVATQLS